MSQPMKNEPPSPVAELIPYHGLRCEIDLSTCQLHFVLDDERISFPLPTEMSSQQQAPLEYQGEGLCLLNAEQGGFVAVDNWKPGTRYALLLSDTESYLYREDDSSRRQLLSTRQLIYPGIYRREKGPGPFDLFVSQDQRFLAVSNRSEGHVMILDTQRREQVATRQFKTLLGPKAMYVALDSHSRNAWICGADHHALQRWNWAEDRVETAKGPWRQPSAVVVQDQTLWLLDTHQDTLLHALSLPDLKALARIRLEGGSFARDTDAPADLMHLDSRGKWLAVMTHVNLPEPFSPRVSVIHTQEHQADIEFQPTGRGFPRLLGSAQFNPALKFVMEQQPLNLALSARAVGLERALLNRYGMHPDQLESHLLILSGTEAMTVDLPDTLALLILDHMRLQLREHGLHVASPVQTPAEQELMIQAARLARLLRSHDSIQVWVLQALGEASIELQLDRRGLLQELQEQGSQLEQGLSQKGSQTQDEGVWNLRAGDHLPWGWNGLADPLNSRILQLDSELKNVWHLETTLFGVYRPIDVCWLPHQRFAVLDGERNRVTCWNHLAQQEWALEIEGGNWNRMVLSSDGQRASLYLIDTQAGKLIQSDLQGQLQENLNTGIQQVQDMCGADFGQLWVLGRSGQLNRWHPQDGVQQEIRFGGFPSVLARSREHNAVALFDGQLQKLWLLKDGDHEPQGKRLLGNLPRYRIGQPLGIQWRSENEVLLYDAYRLLLIDVNSGQVKSKKILQELSSGRHNLAPASLFIAKAQQAFQVQGGTQTSLLKMLKRVPLFQDVAPNFLRELVMRVKTRIHSKGDTLVQRGDEGQEMFIIRQGEVAVLDSQDKAEVASMGVGDIFGEVALMLSVPRNATVKAKGYCELFSIAQDELDALLPAYPGVKARLIELAEARQKQEKLRSSRELERLSSRVSDLARQSSRSSTAVQGAEQKSLAQPGPKLGPLHFWAQHSKSGQMALLNRYGVVSRLLGPQQELVKPIAVIQSMEDFWVLDRGLNQLILLDENLEKSVVRQQWGSHELQDPRALAEAPNGSLWLANTGAGEILHLTPQGELLQAFALGRAPAGIQILDNQNLLICDIREHTVCEYTLSGEKVWQFGISKRFGRSDEMLFAPEYALRQENGRTLICDTGNSRLLEVDAQGRIHWSLVSSAGLRVTRPSFVRVLDNGHLVIEHSNHFYWLEINRQQQQLWKHSLPIQGFLENLAAIA